MVQRGAYPADRAAALSGVPVSTVHWWARHDVLVPYLMAAVRMYEDRFARRENIEAGMQLGCGHPMGPLTLCDFIGFRLGRKSGRGFYDYREVSSPVGASD